MKYFLPTLLIITMTGMFSCDKEVRIAQFRGAERNGIYPGEGLMDEWPDGGPALIWTCEGLGRGYASPAVSEESIFVCGEEEGRAVVFALDLEGQFLWKAANGEEFLGEGFSSTYPGARSTPTVYGDRIYATSGHGRLTCLDAETGAELWSVHMVDDFGGELGYFGYSESVAVDEEKVYCFPAGPEHNVVALDRMSGELAWSSTALLDTFAYGSPVLLDLPGGPALMHTSRHAIFILDRNSGALLSSYPLEGYEYDGEHCNTPVFEQGHICFVANDVPGQGSMKVQLSDDGSLLEEVWRNNEVLNNFGGFVVLDGSIHTTLKGNRLMALDPVTGMVMDSLKVASGSIIAAGDQLISYGHNGRLNLVGRETGKLVLKGSMKVVGGSGQHFSHPVVAGGILYIRRGDALMAYRIS